MSASEKSSSPRDGGPGGGGPGGLAPDEKPRLTDEQKRQNHITSEQKRRQAIRDAFDKLAALVPGLAGHGRSEGHVLNVSVQYILEKLAERRVLIEQIEAKGGAVPMELKDVLRIDLSQVNLDHITSTQRTGIANGIAHDTTNGT